jgi:hypothetical protein
VKDEESGEGRRARHVLQGAEHRDGRIVDEHIDAVLLHRARDDLARRGLVHVERHPDSTRALELGVFGCGTHGIARRGEDLLAALKRRERECEAEAARCAGDEPAGARSDRGDRCRHDEVAELECKYLYTTAQRPAERTRQDGMIVV